MDDCKIQYRLGKNSYPEGTAECRRYKKLTKVCTVQEARELGKSFAHLHEDFLKRRLRVLDSTYANRIQKYHADSKKEIRRLLGKQSKKIAKSEVH